MKTNEITNDYLVARRDEILYMIKQLKSTIDELEAQKEMLWNFEELVFKMIERGVLG